MSLLFLPCFGKTMKYNIVLFFGWAAVPLWWWCWNTILYCFLLWLWKTMQYCIVIWCNLVVSWILACLGFNTILYCFSPPRNNTILYFTHTDWKTIQYCIVFFNGTHNLRQQRMATTTSMMATTTNDCSGSRPPVPVCRLCLVPSPSSFSHPHHG